MIIPDESVVYGGRFSKEEIEKSIGIASLLDDADPAVLSRLSRTEIGSISDKIVILFSILQRRVVSTYHSHLRWHWDDSHNSSNASHGSMNVSKLYLKESGRLKRDLSAPYSGDSLEKWEQVANEKRVFQKAFDNLMDDVDRKSAEVNSCLESLLDSWQVVHLELKETRLKIVLALMRDLYNLYLGFIMRYLPGRTFVNAKNIF